MAPSFTPDFCGGAIQTIMSFDNSALNPAAVRHPLSSAMWGDHMMECLIIGLNGGSALQCESILRNSGKSWTVFRVAQGTWYSLYDPGYVGVAISYSGNDVTVRLSVTNNIPTGYPNVETSFTVVDVANSMQKLFLSISSTTPTAPNAPMPNGGYGPRRDVTIKASYAGQGATLTGGQGWWGDDNYGAANSFTPIDNTGVNDPLAFSPWARCSVASLSMGFVSVEPDVTDVALARNYLSYQIPAWCYD